MPLRPVSRADLAALHELAVLADAERDPRRCGRCCTAPCRQARQRDASRCGHCLAVDCYRVCLDGVVKGTWARACSINDYSFGCNCGRHWCGVPPTTSLQLGGSLRHWRPGMAGSRLCLDRDRVSPAPMMHTPPRLMPNERGTGRPIADCAAHSALEFARNLTPR